VVQQSFVADFVSRQDRKSIIENIEGLIAQAMDFISDIESLKGIATLVGHDYQTHIHSIKVGWLTAIFIKANPDLFGTKTPAQLREIMIQAAAAGFLHDIGKIKIPKDVINKKGKLNNLEYVLMQSHTAYSTSLLFETQLPRVAMQTILYHHENEDGSGYPCGLCGDQIPLMAKICHIVDVFDALTSKRSYKASRTPYEALQIMAGENPYLSTLRKFEIEVRENPKIPISTIVRDDYEAKLRRLREREMLEEEAEKRVEVRTKLRDQGMSHCFDKDLLRRFILTLNKSEDFNLSGLL
jgi:hypothetical protein